jgi:transposase-like protein
MTIDLTDPIFHDEDKARAYFESVRWPHGPVCPHCGSFNVIRMEGKPERREKNTRARQGALNCRDCREQFSATVGTVFERSHIPMHKWLLANHLMNASKKGVSAHQLHRTLNLPYKTAWFMAHRLREAMRDVAPFPLGGEGKVVEADEAYHGKRETPREAQRHDKYRAAPTKRGKGGGSQKRPIVALVERGGEARAVHMNTVNAKNLRDYMVRNASRMSSLHTDESNLYPTLGTEFAKHETVNHGAKEYARGEGDHLVTTNSVEGFFGIFKRGMVGVYQHCGEQHLQRYLDEFTFRYNHRLRLGIGDAQRAAIALARTEGKRLTYRRISAA